MFESLGLAIKEVGAVETADLSDEELGASLVELARLRAALDAAEARLAGAWDGRRAWAADGARSGAAWLARRTRAPRSECGSRLWLARAVADMPTVAAAWEAGEVDLAHVRRLARAHNPRTAALFARDEDLLVDQARRLSFFEFGQAVDYWSLHADPDGAAQRDVDRRDRRRVSLDQTFSGMYAGSVLLDAVSGAVVAGELARLDQELFEADWAEARARLERDPRTGELARRAEQRRADALVVMARRSAAMAPDAKPARPLFSVLLGGGAFSHLSQLASGEVVSPEALLPWIAEADLERILFADDAQRVISVSRQRSFTGALRRLIEVRDRLCYHDYCEEPAHRCQVDHIIPYAHGGMTSQDNGRLACAYHNRLRNRPRPPPDG